MADCRRRLAYVWFIAVAVLFLLMFVLTMNQRYGDKDRDAWTWFLAAVVPTVSLMIGSVAATAQAKGDRSTVSNLAYRVTMGLSVCYLAVILALLTLHPLTNYTPAQLLETSGVYLPPFQGILGIALGIFFASRKGGND